MKTPAVYKAQTFGGFQNIHKLSSFLAVKTTHKVSHWQLYGRIFFSYSRSLLGIWPGVCQCPQERLKGLDAIPRRCLPLYHQQGQCRAQPSTWDSRTWTRTVGMGKSYLPPLSCHFPTQQFSLALNLPHQCPYTFSTHLSLPQHALQPGRYVQYLHMVCTVSPHNRPCRSHVSSTGQAPRESSPLGSLPAAPQAPTGPCLSIPWRTPSTRSRALLFHCFLCMAKNFSDSPHCLLPAPSSGLRYSKFSNSEDRSFKVGWFHWYFSWQFREQTHPSSVHLPPSSCLSHR